MGHPAQESVHPAARKDGEDTNNSPAALPLISDEPIVTRKELWSYYCIFSSLSPRGIRGSRVVTSVLQRRQRASFGLFSAGLAIENSICVDGI
jgi:hypothetical protein